MSIFTTLFQSVKEKAWRYFTAFLGQEDGYASQPGKKDAHVWVLRFIFLDLFFVLA